MNAAECHQSTFSLRYEVRTEIRSNADTIWSKLTNSAGFPRWNATVTSIEGAIVLRSKLAIRVPIAPDRVFRPKVVEFVPNERMVWRDGFAPMFRGTRTFTLTPNGEGVTTFAMDEVFEGWMLPMIRRSLPDFRPVFERYAEDLRRACESR